MSDQRCPKCDHDAARSAFGICIGCPCASDWHTELSKLKRELDQKYVTPKTGSTAQQAREEG